MKKLRKKGAVPRLPEDGIPGTSFYQHNGKTVPWPKGVTKLEKKYPDIEWW